MGEPRHVSVEEGLRMDAALARIASLEAALREFVAFLDEPVLYEDDDPGWHMVSRASPRVAALRSALEASAVPTETKPSEEGIDFRRLVYGAIKRDRADIRHAFYRNATVQRQSGSGRVQEALEWLDAAMGETVIAGEPDPPDPASAVPEPTDLDPDIAAWRQFTMDLASGKIDTSETGLTYEAFVYAWNAAAQRGAEIAFGVATRLAATPPGPHTSREDDLVTAALTLFDPMTHGSPSKPYPGHTVEAHCAACVQVRARRTQVIRRALQRRGAMPVIGLRAEPTREAEGRDP